MEPHRGPGTGAGDGATLEDVLPAFIELLDSGDLARQEELLARHPALARELRDFRAERAAVASQADGTAEQEPGEALPRRFGRFLLLRRLGKGGMGVVYRAWDTRLEQALALKMMKSGPHATRAEVERFLNEARAVSCLDHPHIVTIRDYGEREGQPYFTMRLVEGGDLRGHVPYYMERPRETAELVATIGQALRHAHQRAILHRDLKPANVLLDAQRAPHLTDFGLALRVDRDERLTEDGTVVGTLNYMAPEQARAERVLSLSVDVYSLGAILYELLAGRPPILSGPPLQMLRRIESEAPPAPAALNAEVDRDLSTICMKCLEKDPARRYENVADLVEDLERWLDGRPIAARRVGRAERAWRWCRRRPLHAAFLATATTLVAALALMVARDAGRREERLRTNASFARHVANEIAQRLEAMGRLLERAGPELAAGLRAWNEGDAEPDGPRASSLQEALEALGRPVGSLENWQLFDRRGVLVARTPRHGIIGTDFSQRDYFQGARAHLGASGPLASVHVSRAYHSLADGLTKFGLSVPVTEGGELVGVLAVSVTTDPDLGMPHLHDESRKAVLVIPGDPSRPFVRPVPELLILLHPDLAPRGEPVGFDARMLPAPTPRECPGELLATGAAPLTHVRRDYRDPFGERNLDYAGPWLAGFAPVERTGMVVIVQQRDG